LQILPFRLLASDRIDPGIFQNRLHLRLRPKQIFIYLRQKWFAYAIVITVIFRGKQSLKAAPCSENEEFLLCSGRTPFNALQSVLLIVTVDHSPVARLLITSTRVATWPGLDELLRWCWMLVRVQPPRKLCFCGNRGLS